MCGIWTRAQFNEVAKPKDLLFAVEQLAHRGPDSYGWFAEKSAMLLHTRLSIIDLGSGGQPLLSYDKKWVGIVNGELYDYKALRSRLEAADVTFKTHSDSEVLLNLFVKEGPSALANISGEWAFIFQRETEKLYFARDLHGVKPLFYRLNSESFTLASELKALSEDSVTLSEDYVKTFIGRMMAPPLTALEDCFHVLPGRLYTFDIAKKKLTWQSLQTLPLNVDRTLKGADALEATHLALKNSVKRRLVADVEVGCYLSGGVDSALTTALAVECGAKPKAFTVGFSDRDFDESEIAAQTANYLGIEHNVCRLSGKNFLSYLKASILAFENPVTNPHGAAKNLLSNMASKSVKVVLSGEGADEWFGGYAYTRIQKILKFQKHHPKLGAELLKLFHKSEMGKSMNHLDGDSLLHSNIIKPNFFDKQPAMFGRLMHSRAYHHITGDSMAERVDTIARDLRSLLVEERADFGPQFSEWDLNIWFSLRVDLLHYILANVGDRQEMAHSLEGRTPFLDPEVIAVAAQTHPNTLLRGLNEKNILKQVAQSLLPPHLAKRKKHPFFAPIKYFYLREHQPQIEHYVNASREATPWLNWTNIDHLFNPKHRTTKSPLENLKNSMRMTLFSLGVIATELRKSSLVSPRGYALPRSVEDLLEFRVQF